MISFSSNRKNARYIMQLFPLILLAFVPWTAKAAGCGQSPAPCGGNSTCVDTTTSYKCTCPKGYTYNRGLRTCVDIDECAVTDPPCLGDDYDPANNTRCVNIPGSFRCECPPGYQVTLRWIRRPYYWVYSCEDINECAVPSACGDPRAACFNKDGTYRCRCPNGTYYDDEKKQCLDVDVCAVANPPCGGSSYCMNVPGGYQCACPPGSGLAYVASVDDCVVDLCATSTACRGNSTCTMVGPTMSACACAAGQAYNSSLGTCTKFSGYASLTIDAGQVCATDATTCPLLDGSRCGLFVSPNTTSNTSPMWPCNRLVSPNGKHKLLLGYNGQLTMYNKSAIVFQTAAPVPRERISLRLAEDGTWSLYNVDQGYDGDFSWYYGTTFAERTGPALAPFRLLVQDDGQAVIRNVNNEVAWTSSTVAAPPAAGRHRRLQQHLAGNQRRG